MPATATGGEKSSGKKKQSAATRAALARKRRRKRDSLISDDGKRQKEAIHKARAHLGDETETLGREEMKGLMQHLTDREPSDAVIDMLMAKAARPTTAKASGDAPANVDGRISKAAALALVARHLDYVAQEGELDAIFDEFDANKNGKLEPAELEGFLKKLRPDSDVSDADTQYVMQECDKNGDGTLTRDEVLPVCAVWQKLVDDHIKRAERAGSTACAIL